MATTHKSNHIPAFSNNFWHSGHLERLSDLASLRFRPRTKFFLHMQQLLILHFLFKICSSNMARSLKSCPQSLHRWCLLSLRCFSNKNAEGNFWRHIPQIHDIPLLHLILALTGGVVLQALKLSEDSLLF